MIHQHTSRLAASSHSSQSILHFFARSVSHSVYVYMLDNLSLFCVACVFHSRPSASLSKRSVLTCQQIIPDYCRVFIFLSLTLFLSLSHSLFLPLNIKRRIPSLWSVSSVYFVDTCQFVCFAEKCPLILIDTHTHTLTQSHSHRELESFVCNVYVCDWLTKATSLIDKLANSH